MKYKKLPLILWNFLRCHRRHVRTYKWLYELELKLKGNAEGGRHKWNSLSKMNEEKGLFFS